MWFIINDTHKQALEEILGAKSDRVTAILGAAMLDDILREVLTSRLRNSSITSRVFSGNGFLGSAAAKIDLAYLMHAIDKPVMQTLVGIAAIRNVFAHNLAATFDLDSREMNNAFNALSLHEGRTTYFDSCGGDSEFPFGAISTRRRQFEVNLQLVLPRVSEDLYSRHYPNTSIPLDTLKEMVRISNN